jgi:DNA anti-recombination protein RmuC
VGRKVDITSYADLQTQNEKLVDESEKLKRENKRLIAENEKEKVCRQMDLEKERERLRGVYQSELQVELESFREEFQKIRSEVDRERNDFQVKMKQCKRYGLG